MAILENPYVPSPLCEFDYKVSFVFRKYKLGRGDGVGLEAAERQGSKTHDRGLPREHRCKPQGI